MNLFEVASRKKYRYPYKGSISTEDLWELTPDELDTIHVALTKQDKSLDEGSLRKRVTNPDLANKMEIVKYIFETKLVEATERVEAAKEAARKQRILGIIAQREDEELANMPLSELKKMVGAE